jgi:hypothetical protein
MASTQIYYTREGETIASIYRSVWRRVAYNSYSDFAEALRTSNPGLNFSIPLSVGTQVNIPYAKS